jgi:hypothetical protein
LLLADFFSVEAINARKIDAAVGNPPFIRYQRFTGDARKSALARSLAEGVRLPELCSSWAPFLVHTIAQLRTGGRLAMVLPMEVGHAKYALPVLEHVHKSFKSTIFLTFREKLFPALNEDTILILAADKGAVPGRFLWRDLPDPESLRKLREDGGWHPKRSRQVNAASIASGKSRLIEYFIPRRSQQLYSELRFSEQVQRLGDVADVGIGYVTGANDFFHLVEADIDRWKIPREFLKPAVRRGRALSGLRFTTMDWETAAKTREAGYLLHIRKEANVPSSLREYLDDGEARRVDQAYKCRTRSPWFCVPHVYKPDAFLTYMSGAFPRLVANDAKVFAPNSLHILRMHPLAAVPNGAMASLWQSSLTRLSVEIEGHALGGGMLKLEPTEAERVLIPAPAKAAIARLVSLSEELDALVRTRVDELAWKRADEIILKDMIGLSERDCKLLRLAADTLRRRRGYGDSTNGIP